MMVLAVFLGLLALQGEASPKAIIVIYEDGTRVTVSPWRFVYFCESPVGAPPGLVRELNCGDKDLLLHLGTRKEGKVSVNDYRLIRGAELGRIRWEYGQPKDGSRVVSRVLVTLRNGEVLTVPELRPSNDLAQKVTGNSGAEIRRFHLGGKARTAAGTVGDFLEPNLDRTSTYSPDDTIVEIVFDDRLKHR